MVAAWAEFAPAKLNLALHVTGRRPDGYHTLDTLVAFAKVGDRLTASPTADGLPLRLEVVGPFAGALRGAGPPETNLVLRAAHALAAAAGRPAAGVHLVLDKAVPLGAGLGGGSADAAAALRLLDRVWGLGLAAARLAAIGAGIGADVPMCLANRPLRATGIGETVEPLDLPALPLVLVWPGAGTSTGAVFRRYRPPFDDSLRPDPDDLATPRGVAAWLKGTTNGLRHAARAELPVIGNALATIASDSNALHVQMTGSGSAAFGIFAKAELAARAAERIGRLHPGWWVMATETAASPARAPLAVANG